MTRTKSQNGSEAVTRGIRVTVASRYEEDKSAPEEGYYFFSYTVRITNEGSRPAQLWSRRWVITDGDGNREVVEGDGVVGHQPNLAPGESFEYTSFCPLPTPVGAMEGTYLMRTGDGGDFKAEIASFTLAVPAAVN
jgi:ApaG protein